MIPNELEVIDFQWLRRAGNGEQQGSSLGSLKLQKWSASFVPGGMMVTDSHVFSQGPLNPVARVPTLSVQKEGALLSSPVHRTLKKKRRCLDRFQDAPAYTKSSHNLVVALPNLMSLFYSLYNLQHTLGL